MAPTHQSEDLPNNDMGVVEAAKQHDMQHGRNSEIESSTGTSGSYEDDEESEEEKPRTVLRRIADALLVVCGTTCGCCVSATAGCADVTANACFPTDPPGEVLERGADQAGAGGELALDNKSEASAAAGALAAGEVNAEEAAAASLVAAGAAAEVALQLPVAMVSEAQKASLLRWELKGRRRLMACEQVGMIPGATVETISKVIMREGEDMTSNEVAELKAGELFVIQALGFGRRIKVRSVATGQEGWVSKSSAAGGDLLALKYEAPGEAYGPNAEALVDTAPVIMRQGEDLESEKVCDCQPGERLRVLEAPTARRVKVERLETGEVGWVSATGQDRARFLKLVREQPERASGFVVGAVIESLRAIVMRAQESRESKNLRECTVGEQFVLIELGADCRMRVRHMDHGTVGWVSSASTHGGFLFNVRSPGFRKGQAVETVSKVVVRETEDLRSAPIGAIDVGEQVVILEPPLGRRLKVKACSSGAVGWVSSFTEEGEQLLWRGDMPPELAPSEVGQPPAAVMPSSSGSETEVGDEGGAQARAPLLRRLVGRVLPACGSAVRGVARCVGGVAVAIGAAVGLAAAAPFWGCYHGVLGCANCGSAVCRRCRPKALAPQALQQETSVPPTSAPRAPQAATVLPAPGDDDIKVEELDALMRLAAQIKHPSGCFLCSFTTMASRKE
mmetsp:Transcript_45330/g.130880  ORF Transcript_45330/g.130880 Transcript_45330/m.130880 type:complete len:679 (-) Transcript_45330:66-2102(-)